MQVPGCGLRVASSGLRVASCGLRVAGCELRVAGCGLRVAGYSMLDAGYSMQTAGVYLFVGLLEFHQKLNYAFLRHRKRRSEAIPSFVVRHSSFVPPELRVTGKKGMAGRGQKTDDRSQMTADRKQMTEGFDFGIRPPAHRGLRAYAPAGMGHAK